MGFFKEFKNDLSQAVNELLPDESDQVETEDQIETEEHVETEDQMVNTLDTEEAAVIETSENEKMKEWLAGFAQEEEAGETDLSKDELPEDITEVDFANAEKHFSEEFEEELEEELEYELDENLEVVLKQNIYKNNENESEEEGEEMDDNVDLDLLEVLNAEEEEEKSVETKERTFPKLRATQVANDDEVTVITKGTTINGSISSDGSLDIMGTITGDIECLGKLSISGKITGNSSAAEIYINAERLEGCVTSEGSVKVGLGTVVIGDIIATSGVIAGAVKGEIDINGPIVIDSTAIIKGNIKAKSVQINNGAVIEGFCSLSYSAVDMDNIFE